MEAKALQVSEYYDEYWRRRLKLKGRKLDPVAIEIVKKVSTYPPPLNILDVGCGNGDLTVELRKYGYVVGTDISEVALKKAKTRKIDVIKAEAHKLPFSKNSFDVVICSEVLEHVFSPSAVLKEIKRVLKDQGRLILSVPNMAWLPNRIALLFGNFRDYSSIRCLGDRNEVEIEHIGSSRRKAFWNF